MSSIKAIIVDDESAARNVLRKLLVWDKREVEIVSECANLIEAVTAINAHKPDVVFLDVNMPDHAGYEIANFFSEINFEIVFITAYDEFAIKAFELSAVDYIVKPIERSRLEEALQKTEERIGLKKDSSDYQLLLQSIGQKDLGKISITELKDGQVLKTILNLKEIIAIKADGAYCQIHLIDSGIITISRNLKHFESRLPNDSVFFRCHRSWIVNLDFIKSYASREGEIILTGGLVAKLSKSRQKLFEATQKNHS